MQAFDNQDINSMCTIITEKAMEESQGIY